LRLPELCGWACDGSLLCGCNSAACDGYAWDVRESERERERGGKERESLFCCQKPVTLLPCLHSHPTANPPPYALAWIAIEECNSPDDVCRGLARTLFRHNCGNLTKHLFSLWQHSTTGCLLVRIADVNRRRGREARQGTLHAPNVE